MIWWTLALFAVSFLVTALLAPKPDIENARKQDLEPDSFPRATEDAPIPLVIGRVRVNAPNTIDYGDFQARPIKEKVKTGLFSSTTFVKGHKYYLGMDLGLHLGPGGLLFGVYMDEELVYSGEGTIVEEDATFWLDETMGGSTGAIVYEEVDLLTATGLTAEAFDSLASLGELTVTAQCSFESYLTPIAGGGPSDGSYTLATQMWSGSGGTGTQYFPVEGVGAVSTSQTTGGSQVMSVTYTMAEGARFLRYGTQLTPTLILFTDLSINQGYALASYTRVHGAGEYPIATVTSNINEPDLWGGAENGGGWVGNFTYYPGTFDQAVDVYMEGLAGIGNIPAYRGMAHIVLGSNGSPSYIGESPNLRKMAFDCAVYPDNLVSYIGSRIRVGYDVNPAEALYEILTNSWRGLSVPAELVDIDSFITAALTLYTEGAGVSVQVTASSTAKKVIGEILRTIDAIMFQDPTTGKFTIKLIRNDYTAGSLAIYDEDDIAAVRSLSKTSWEEVVSEVKVSYSTREKETGKVAIAQDMAVANMIGRRKTSSISFPFVYDATFAAVIAARELSQLSVPLLKVQLELNRSAYSIKPGDVFKMSFPEYGISEVILRAVKYDLGEMLDNKVVIECVEDKFGVGTVVFAEPADSAWADPVPTVTNVASTTWAEMPYFFSSNLEFPILDGYGAAIPFPVSGAPATSTGFRLNAGVVSGTLDVNEPSNAALPVYAELVSQYLNTVGFVTGVDAAGLVVKNVLGTLTAATSAQIQSGNAGLIYVGGEWMGYEGVTDNLDDTYILTNVHRGLLGTRPLTHSADAALFVLTTDLLGKGTLGDSLLEDGTLYYKTLDIAESIIQDPLGVTESSFALSDVADRPLRPRNLQVDTSRAQPWDVSADPTVTLSWVPSNRSVGSVSFETDASETPDLTEVYDVEVWIDGVDESVTYGATGVAGTSQAIDLTLATGFAGELRVYARRTVDDLKSSVYYSFYPFTFGNAELLSGDEQISGTDAVLLSGDEQSGTTDTVLLSGDG